WRSSSLSYCVMWHELKTLLRVMLASSIMQFFFLVIFGLFQRTHKATSLPRRLRAIFSFLVYLLEEGFNLLCTALTSKQPSAITENVLMYRPTEYLY
ncbi:hypothetical protein L9F63_007633, partial [Diploptera punctata]